MEVVPYWVYILECKDGTFYTGISNNLEKRIATHNAGKASKYTRARLPVVLRYQEEVKGRSLASKREFEIKRLTKQEKKKLFR